MAMRKFAGAVALVVGGALAGLAVQAAETGKAAAVAAADEVQLAQDAAAGRVAFIACAACHTINKGDPNRVGPNLNGIIGKKAAAVAGFAYSDPFKKGAADIVWTEAKIDEWITMPAKMIAGTKMTYPGQANETTRKNIIAYMKSVP